MLLGLISDTHGWLDPAALAALAGVDAILHAGDIGDGTVLTALAAVAPLHAVRGNNDRGTAWAAIPEVLDLDLAGHRIHLVHRPEDARPEGAGIVVTGHTHRLRNESRDGVWWLNPGASGRRGFHKERTLLRVRLLPGSLRVEPVYLGPRSARQDRITT